VRRAYRNHTLLKGDSGLKSRVSQNAIGSVRRSQETLIVSALSHNPNRPSEVTAITDAKRECGFLLVKRM
jgi:hypothetical protein